MEAGDLATNLPVGPSDDFAVGDLLATSEGIQDGENVESHHLPDQGECQSLVGIHDVLALNTDEGEVDLLSEFDAVVTVLELLVGVWWVPVDTLLVNDSGLNLVEELEQDDTISEIFVEVVDEWVDSKRVHPVSEGLFLAGLFDLDLEFNGLQSWPVIEQVGNEGKIELLVSLANVLGSDEFSALELLGSLEDRLGSLLKVSNLKTVTVAVLGSNLSEKDGVVLGILNVTGEVGDTSSPTSVLEVVVEPSKEDLLNGELKEVLNGFTLLQKAVKLGMVDQVNLREQTNLHNLPDETENQMRLSVNEILSTNVNNVATDSLGRVDSKSLVLVNTERVQVLLVHHTLVDGFRYSIVDEFAHDETITNTLEETHVFSVHGESRTYIGILFQGVVNVVSKSDLLFVREGMGGSVGTTANLVNLSALSSSCHLCRLSNE